MADMTGRFGAFLAGKRCEKDARLKPIAERMGISVSYLSDIFNGRRYPPDIEGLEAIAEILNLNEGERNEMFDLAGRERNQVSPDLLEYIMDETLPSLRDALRKAKAQSLGEEFWQEISRIPNYRRHCKADAVKPLLQLWGVSPFFSFTLPTKIC